jgi:hypothetical protein
MLSKLLARTWPFTAGAAATGFLATIVLVRLIGVEGFANYAIDLAKLSLFLLLLELIPSSYVIFRQQEDETLAADLASFVCLALLVLPAAVLIGGGVGVFSHFSIFMVVYAAGSVIQRYFDSRFQAQGRIGDFFLLPLVTNVIRLLLLLGFWLIPLSASPADMAWGSLAAGILGAQAFFLLRHPAEVSAFIHSGHLRALQRLWSNRGQYVAYYPNIVLKRLRDTAMPLVCDFFAADKFEAGKYLLAYRGVDFSIGQLRVIESFFSNAGLRDALKARGGTSLLLLAVFGQLVAIVAGLLLVGQAELTWSSVTLIVLASLFVYPYVLELSARSDAYAQFRPRRVTISLLAFVAGIAIVLATAAPFTKLTALVLILAPLLGQCLASLSYKVFK